jgi:hypothetical protein
MMTREEALKRLAEAKAKGELYRGLPAIARALGLPEATARRALEAGLVQRAVFIPAGTGGSVRGHWIAVRPALRQLSLPLEAGPGGAA